MHIHKAITKMIEDRISIKVTQRLRRKPKPTDYSKFFTKNRYKIQSLEAKLIKDIDDLIKEYMNEIS